MTRTAKNADARVEDGGRQDVPAPQGGESRPYVQGARAAKTAATGARILREAERLFSHELFDRVTLDAVARLANVTIPTLQRRYGDKEGLFLAVAESMRARVGAQRASPLCGDVELNLRQLVDHYEAEGRTVWHLLRQEADIPILGKLLPQARAFHRAWVEQAFGAGPQARTDALVVATDLFIWKLLRLDLGRTREATEAVMRRTVGLILAEDP